MEISGNKLKEPCLSSSANSTLKNCLEDHCHLLKSKNLRLQVLKFAHSYMQVFTALNMYSKVKLIL